MNVVGIALIVIGLTLVCGGLILLSRASRTRRASKSGSEAAPVSEMADLLRRLHEVSDDDFFNKQRARLTVRLLPDVGRAGRQQTRRSSL